MTEVTIRLRDDGPLVVTGPIVVYDATGKAFSLPADKPNVALCRCGHSAARPFCDGAHKRCGFQAAERAPEDA